MTSEYTEISQQEHAQPASPDEDTKLVNRLKEAIFRSAKGFERFKEQLPFLLRKAIDEVIDAPRTGRFTVDELEKTEKTYLGTKVEILLRNWLRFPRGRALDLVIDGIETDVKNTMGDSWMIPTEAVGHPCLLVKTNEKLARFSIGIIVARPEFLRPGVNKDGKRGISATGQQRIHWILKDESYPENFWQGFDDELRRKIMSQSSGAKRVDALFRYVQKKPISRSHVLAVAQQKDAMKRLRRNGGARDSLASDGIELLSGTYDSARIETLGLPKCKKDEFISFASANESNEARSKPKLS